MSVISRQRWSLRRLAGLLTGGGPFLLYYLWIVAKDPLLGGWNAQNLTPSPPAWDVFLSLSPAIWLAIPGLAFAWKRGGTGPRLLALWLVAGLLLICVPYGLQRRFLLGLYVPVAGLAAAGAWRLVAIRPRLGVWALAGMFLLATPTNLLVMASGLDALHRHDPALYLAKGERALMDWLVKSTPDEAVVLAAPETGLLIPAHSGRRVLYGHPFETFPAELRLGQVTGFYSGEATSTDRSLLAQVDYVVYGPRERALNPAQAQGQAETLSAPGGEQAGEARSPLAALSGLECVYDYAGIQVYRVAPQAER
jgi:hypothetical protein